MLTLTTEAAAEIRRLTDRSDLPDSSGLRITNEPPGAFHLRLAAVPAGDDAVVDTAGARIFLDPQAATVLDDKTLDASTEADGRVHFKLAQQRL